MSTAPETLPAFEGVRFIRWLVEKWLPLRVLICRGQWLTPHSKTNTCEWKTTSQRRQNPSPSGPPEPNTNNWLQHKTHTHYLVRFCSSCLNFSRWLWSCFLPSLCRLPFFRRLVRNTVVWVFWFFFPRIQIWPNMKFPWGLLLLSLFRLPFLTHKKNPNHIRWPGDSLS